MRLRGKTIIFNLNVFSKKVQKWLVHGRFHTQNFTKTPKYCQIRKVHIKSYPTIYHTWVNTFVKPTKTSKQKIPNYLKRGYTNTTKPTQSFGHISTSRHVLVELHTFLEIRTHGQFKNVHFGGDDQACLWENGPDHVQFFAPSWWFFDVFSWSRKVRAKFLIVLESTKQILPKTGQISWFTHAREEKLFFFFLVVGFFIHQNACFRTCFWMWFWMCILSEKTS